MSISPKLSEVTARIDTEIASAVAELARLITCDTTSPPGNGYGALCDLLEEILTPLGYSCRRVEVPRELWYVPRGPAQGPRINLIAERADADPSLPVCSLYFHTDTVCAATGWTRDPFALTEEAGTLYGLGAADMKGTMAAAIHALRVALQSNLPLAYREQLLFVTDEEGGLYPGIRYLAEQGEIGGHLLNFNGSAGPRIWGGCFGSFNLQVTVNGYAAHAADRARQGINAIEASLPAMQAVLALRPGIEALQSALPTQPGQPPFSPTLAITVAQGGTCGGQVPDRFQFLVSRRYAPEENYAEARAAIETAIRAASPVDVTLDFDLIGHLIPTADPRGPHYPRWQRAMEEGFGYRPEDFTRYGAVSASDSGWIQQSGYSQEIILSGLIRPTSNAHGAEEHTTRSDLAALSRTILHYLAKDFEPGLNPDVSPRQE